MRLVGILAVLCLVASGCKSKGDADAAPDPAAIKAQQELVAKRDAMLKKRQELEKQADQLDQQINEAKAAGSDTADLEKQKDAIQKQIDSQQNDYSEINSKLDQIKISGDKAAQIASREADISSRERAIAEREAAVAQREKALSQREVDMAQRWKDSCSIAAAPAPVVITKPDGKYTKKDVSDLVARARAQMNRKGLLASDLGSNANLESEASKALNDNDVTTAYFAASHLLQAVDAIAINRAFIQAKYNRLAAQVKGSKGDEKQLADILGDVMQKYNDGNFTAANVRLNQLAGMLH
jgi:DNA repair exonuclease SbcCD ATPase subunit